MRRFSGRGGGGGGEAVESDDGAIDDISALNEGRMQLMEMFRGLFAKREG